MPTFRYHLNDAKTPAVEIDWNPQWKDMAVRAHGQPVGVIASREEMVAGRQFDLDGQTLTIHLPKGSFVLPEVTLDGQPLYPPQQSPAARLQRASMTIFIVGAMHVVVGVRPLLLNGVPFDQLPPENWIPITSGVVFLVLSGLVRLRSLGAAVTALVLLGLSTALGVGITLLRAPEQGVPILFVIALLVQTGLLLGVYQGIGAIRTLNRGQ